MNKLNLQMARIRHADNMQRMRTDIHHLEVKASSMQQRASTIIHDVSTN
jgi:hypothetical protein